MSDSNAGLRNGTRASSTLVIIVIWLTCLLMSMSDQRTETGATNPGWVMRRSSSSLRSASSPAGSTCCSSPASARHRANLARRDRQCGQIVLTAFVNFAQRSPRPFHPRRAGVLPLGDLLFTGFIGLTDGEHVETQRPQRRVDVVTNGQARQ